MNKKNERIHTAIWHEIPEKDNPFIASECYCCGYDVYGEVLGSASWIEYLFLLFKQERPDKAQVFLLENLAIALANPGLRDHSVRAAMNAGVGGSTYASCLIASLAVGAGQLGGAREVAICMEYWLSCGQDLSSWKSLLTDFDSDSVDVSKEKNNKIWEELEHPPGFNPHGRGSIKPVIQTLSVLTRYSQNGAVNWLERHLSDLEKTSNCSLAFSGVAAAVFTDLGFSSSEGEMMYLLLRLPGAAVHALEQEKQGWRRYPFFADGLELINDPGPINQQQKNDDLLKVST